MEYTVLVPHLGDKPLPYLKGETRTISNSSWAAELIASGVIAEPVAEPEPAPKPKPKSKK